MCVYECTAGTPALTVSDMVGGTGTEQEMETKDLVRANSSGLLCPFLPEECLLGNACQPINQEIL